MMGCNTYFCNLVQGAKYKTINQIAELVLRKLLTKVLSINFKNRKGNELTPLDLYS